MNYSQAVELLEKHNSLFTFDAVRPHCDNKYGRDLLTNEEYQNDNLSYGGSVLTAYNYMISMAENNDYDANQKRAFIRLVKLVINDQPKTLQEKVEIIKKNIVKAGYTPKTMNPYYERIIALDNNDNAIYMINAITYEKTIY